MNREYGSTNMQNEKNVIPCLTRNPDAVLNVIQERKKKRKRSFYVYVRWIPPVLRYGAGMTRERRGMTMLEVLVSMSIFVVASFIIYSFVAQGYRLQRFSFESERAIATTQRGLEIMVKEIREATNSAIGAYPIISGYASALSFYADFDRDHMIERVRYFLDGTTLKKGIIEPTGNPIEYVPSSEIITTLSEYVRNAETATPLFTYYDGNWPGDTVNNPLPVPANVKKIRLIHILIRVNIIPNQAPSDFELQSDVQIRNLKDNL